TSPIAGGLNADLYYLGLEREGAHFAQGTANEKRQSIGTRLWGKLSELDYNFEFIYQFGQFGSGNINAWTTASDTGYTFKDFLWRESVHDAVYRQPNIAIAGTQNSLNRFTGIQPYVLSTWQIDPHISVTLTYVYFKAGKAIKNSGGGDSKYLGGWISYRF